MKCPCNRYYRTVRHDETVDGIIRLYRRRFSAKATEATENNLREGLLRPDIQLEVKGIIYILDVAYASDDSIF
jgi:hypothetical protein